MKIGVISDTHLKGPEENLSRLIHMHFAEVDLLLHAGDYVDESVLEMFSFKDFVGVSGNMDSYSLSSRMSEKELLEIEGFRIGLVHGWGSPAKIEKRVLKAFDKVDAVVFGHTHKAANKKVGDTLLFNPGSPTDRFFARQNTLGLLFVEDKIRGEIIVL